MAERRVLRTYRMQEQQMVVGRNNSSAHVSPAPEKVPATDGQQTVPSDDATLQQAQSEAEQILEGAQQQAQAILQQAQEEGYQRGYDEGLQAGQEAGKGIIAAEVQRVREVAESGRAERLNLITNLEGEIVELVLAVARKVIGDELAQNRDSVASIVKQAAAQLSGAGPLRVRLHPDDAERLKEHWSAGKSLTGSDQDWELVSDERVSPGGCIIEAGPGSVDARLETQMTEISRTFRELAGTG